MNNMLKMPWWHNTLSIMFVLVGFILGGGYGMVVGNAYAWPVLDILFPKYADFHVSVNIAQVLMVTICALAFSGFSPIIGMLLFFLVNLLCMVIITLVAVSYDDPA